MKSPISITLILDDADIESLKKGKSLVTLVDDATTVIHIIHASLRTEAKTDKQRDEEAK